MHLPRSVFSERQTDLVSWLLAANGVQDVPSVKAMKRANKVLQESCGIRTIAYTGALGHRYHVNSLCDIIAQVRSCITSAITDGRGFGCRKWPIPMFNHTFDFSQKTPANLSTNTVKLLTGERKQIRHF